MSVILDRQAEVAYGLRLGQFCHVLAISQQLDYRQGQIGEAEGIFLLHHVQEYLQLS